MLRLLWEDFKAAGEYYSGITADDVPEIVSRATELDLTGLIADLTQTAMPVDYAKFLKPLGVVLEASEIPVERKLLGISGSGSDAGFTVRQVYDKETAQWIGIAPGDVIIALDGVRVKGNNLSELLARYGEGDEILIHAFRDDALLAWAVLLGKPKTFQSGHQTHQARQRLVKLTSQRRPNRFPRAPFFFQYQPLRLITFSTLSRGASPMKLSPISFISTKRMTPATRATSASLRCPSS